jgi:hypothetical protein
MTVHAKILKIGVLTSALLLASAETADAAKYIQEVKNKSATTANDLTVTFTGALTGGPTIVAGGQTFNPTPNGNTYTWAAGNLPTVGSGEVAAVRFETNTGARIDPDDAKSFFTEDGAHILNSLGTVAQAGSFSFDGLGGGLVTLTNFSAFAIDYTNVQLFSDNVLGSFTLAGFDAPTGVLVGGFPTSFSLAAGQSLSFAFSGVSAGTYELFLADVAAASAPGETFRIGFGDAIPEPGTWALMLIGFGLAGAALRRGRGVRRQDGFASAAATLATVRVEAACSRVIAA